jgi:hypothetical protein
LTPQVDFLNAGADEAGDTLNGVSLDAKEQRRPENVISDGP